MQPFVLVMPSDLPGITGSVESSPSIRFDHGNFAALVYCRQCMCHHSISICSKGFKTPNSRAYPSQKQNSRAHLAARCGNLIMPEIVRLTTTGDDTRGERHV
jgi:hypothetical protein